jgi:AcrR family transcriptional regulator
MSTLTRYDRRRRETADRIVAAAAELFGEHGVRATKVADICARADVAQQTFFNHFPAKQDLVRELVRRGHDFFMAAVEAACREGSTTGERLARLFEKLHTAAREVGPMHQDLAAETFRAASAESDAERTREMRRAVSKLVRAGRAEGDVTQLHAVDDLVTLILGTLSQLLFEWANRIDVSIADRAARIARLLANALAPQSERRATRIQRRFTQRSR